MSYHNDLQAAFVQNINSFSEQIGFVVEGKCKTNQQLGRYGEIDVIARGTPIDLEGIITTPTALIEVKGHHGLIGKFERKQFPVYLEYMPNAKIFLLYGYKKSLLVEDMTLVKYK